MEGLAEASNQLQETISGIAVVKAYAMEGVTAARFEDVNQELYRRQLGLVRANAAMPAVIGLLPALSMCIILYVGGLDILAGEMGVLLFDRLLARGWLERQGEGPDGEIALTPPGSAALEAFGLALAPLNPWRFMTPANPLPLDMPAASARCPASSTSPIVISWPSSYSSTSSTLTSTT